MGAKAVTLGKLVKDAEARILASANVDLWRTYIARLDAEEMMSEVLGRTYGKDDRKLVASDGVRKRFKRMVDRRESGEPVALIIGHLDFRGLDLVVRRDVFTPRFSSELMAAQALKRLRSRRAPVAVDVACGAGAVALAVASEVGKARVYGLDIAPAAVSLSRENARRLKIKNARFLAGDLMAPMPKKLRGQVDVITIHPPYVARAQVRTLSREIRDFEPPESLTDRSSDGLGLVRRLAPEAHDWLSHDGWLIVEVAPDLARSVRSVMLRNGYRDVSSKRDSVGATRVIVGCLR